MTLLNKTSSGVVYKIKYAEYIKYALFIFIVYHILVVVVVMKLFNNNDCINILEYLVCPIYQ